MAKLGTSYSASFDDSESVSIDNTSRLISFVEKLHVGEEKYEFKSTFEKLMFTYENLKQ